MGNTQLPRYIGHRQLMAEKAGLRVDNWKANDEFLQRWRGGEAAFAATGLLGKRFAFPTGKRKRRLFAPYGLGFGYVGKLGEDEYELEFSEPVPLAIRQERIAEVLEVEYAHGNELWYHGREDALLAANIITTRQRPPNGEKPRSTRKENPCEGWWVQREWDGWIVFGTLTAQTRDRREKESKTLDHPEQYRDHLVRITRGTLALLEGEKRLQIDADSFQKLVRCREQACSILLNADILESGTCTTRAPLLVGGNVIKFPSPQTRQ